MEYLEREDIKISTLKETNIRKYNLKMVEDGYSNSTIARKNSSLRLFLRFLRKEGIMNYNPMEEIKQPTVQERETELTIEDIENLNNIITYERDKLLISLAYHEKMKVNEIIQLKRKDILKDQGIIKTDKRAFLLTEETMNLLKDMEFDTENIFVNQHYHPLTESGAYFILKSLFKKIGKKELRPIDLYKQKRI